MKNIFLILALTLMASFVYANPINTTAEPATPQQPVRNSKKMTDAHVMGDVLDKASGEHLAFITISVKGTTIGTSTDATGHYFLKNLPIGKFTIVASSIGYKTEEKEIFIELDKTLELNFSLAEDAVMLDNIVVTANRGEIKRREASNIVSVLTPKLFETTNSVCLAQGLNFQPGVRVENDCQNCGFTQVRINGLDGPYTQMLINGRAISGALAGVYGLEQIPANMIERVEVVRGGGSALYGSNAIAGTINIITKEPLRNTVSVGNTTTLIGGTKFDVNTNVNAALVSDDNKYGISLYGTTRQRQGWDANADGFTEVSEINSHNFGLNTYFKTSTQTKLSFEYHNTNEYRRGGDSLMLPAHDANITEMIEHQINMGGAKFDWFTRDSKHRLQLYASAQHIHRDSYYGAQKDPNAYGTTTDLTSVTGVQYVFGMENCLFMPANFTIGTEFHYNNLKDYKLSHNDSINGEEVRVIGREIKIDQTINTYSAYAQNEWKNKRWTILLGVRMDKNSMIKNPIFSPRANFRYNPTAWLSLRTGYAMGFRAPQTFDEDLHISTVQGVREVIVNDPNLRPETSHSFNFSADFNKSWDNVHFNFLVDGFYNVLNDIFETESNRTLDPSTGDVIRTRINVADGATVRGVNLEARIFPMRQLNIQLGATIQQSFYNDSAKSEILRTPKSYGYITMNYNPTKALTLSASGTYTGPMFVEYAGVNLIEPEIRTTKNFFDFNLKVAYDFYFGTTSCIQLNAGVQNIFNSYQDDFDKGADRDAGYIYGPSLPRSYVIGLKYSL